MALPARAAPETARGRSPRCGYDRVNVAEPGVPLRLMPDPLDVAYAALGNDHAALGDLSLVEKELELTRVLEGPFR